MFNTFLHSSNKTSLTGILDVVANSVSLIVNNSENNEDESISIQGLYVNKNKISTATAINVPIGFSQFILQYEFNSLIDDNHVPGLESFLDSH